MACDLWSLGATFAEFFTTLHRRADGDDDDDVDTEEMGDPTKAYLSDELPLAWPSSQWERYSLFDGSRGDIGLAWYFPHSRLTNPRKLARSLFFLFISSTHLY